MQSQSPEPDSSYTAISQPSQYLTGRKRKRRRKVLSCLECRRKKLQCDREQPACGRCVGLGCGDECRYVSNENSKKIVQNRTEPDARDDERAGLAEASSGEPAQYSQESIRVASRLDDQNTRLKCVEHTLLQTNQCRSPNQTRVMTMPATTRLPSSNGILCRNGDSSSMTNEATVILRGESFNTRYCGPTSIGEFLTANPKLETFSRQAMEKYPELQRVRRATTELEDATEPTRKPYAPAAEIDLVALLPARVEADIGVRSYLENQDLIYHIFHLPSFWKEYNAMWANTASVRTHFVAITLLMVSASQPSDPRSVAKIQACEAWLKSQNCKSVTASDFQIQILLVLCKLMSYPKFKRAWLEVTELISYCKYFGLHHDAESIKGPTSALDKELRRRIWLAVAELELQISLDTGMVPNGCPEFSPPGNILDEDIDPTADWLPSAQPITRFTSSSYMAIAATSLSLRQRVVAALNQGGLTLAFEDVKRFTDEFYLHLGKIPKWVGCPSAERPRALLDLNLRQYLLAMHTQMLLSATLESERSLSKTSIFTTASKVISTHKLFNDGCQFASGVYCDQVRAGQSLFQLVSVQGHEEDPFIQIVEPHASILMEDVIRMTTNRRNLWALLAAHGLWKTQRQPHMRETYLEQVVGKMVGACYEMIASRQNQLNGEV